MSKLPRFTYFIACAAIGLVKIGRSYNPTHRASDLRGIIKKRVKVLAVFSEDVLSEKDAHARFSQQRERGEWFRITEDDVSALCQEIPMVPISNFQNQERNGCGSYPQVSISPSAHAALKAHSQTTGVLISRLATVAIDAYLAKCRAELRNGGKVPKGKRGAK